MGELLNKPVALAVALFFFISGIFVPGSLELLVVFEASDGAENALSLSGDGIRSLRRLSASEEAGGRWLITRRATCARASRPAPTTRSSTQL